MMQFYRIENEFNIGCYRIIYPKNIENIIKKHSKNRPTVLYDTMEDISSTKIRKNVNNKLKYMYAMNMGIRQIDTIFDLGDEYINDIVLNLKYMHFFKKEQLINWFTYSDICKLYQLKQNKKYKINVPPHVYLYEVEEEIYNKMLDNMDIILYNKQCVININSIKCKRKKLDLIDIDKIYKGGLK